MSKYIVESIVCDWAIYSIDNYENKELVEVCNSKANAELICEILNADLFKDGKYTIWKDQQIADLEAKLAESEEELNRYAELFGMKDKDFYVVEKTEYEKMKQGAKEIVAQLKQQLAEKDKEIEELKKGVYKVTLGTTPSNQINFTENFYVIQNQTAIAELEKVVEFIKEYPHEPRYWDIASYIDQQIKELKGTQNGVD